MITPIPMRVAVITPYYREPLEVLWICHESVLKQTYRCTHFMVADGYPQTEVSTWNIEHIQLSASHCDVGNTPRGIGSMSAMNLGYDAICFLDADNWYYPNHVETMVSLHQHTGAAVCTTSRMMHRLDGSFMYVDRTDCDGKNHVDTSCFFVTSSAFRVLPIWMMMPPQLGPIGDRIFWRAVVSRGISCAHNMDPTVAFRTQYDMHYTGIGETPPPKAKSYEETVGKALNWMNSLPENTRNELMRHLESG